MSFFKTLSIISSLLLIISLSFAWASAGSYCVGNSWPYPYFSPYFAFPHDDACGGWSRAIGSCGGAFNNNPFCYNDGACVFPCGNTCNTAQQQGKPSGTCTQQQQPNPSCTCPQQQQPNPSQTCTQQQQSNCSGTCPQPQQPNCSDTSKSSCHSNQENKGHVENHSNQENKGHVKTGGEGKEPGPKLQAST